MAQSWFWANQTEIKKEAIAEVLTFFIDDKAAIISNLLTSDNCYAHLNEFSSKSNVLELETPNINNTLTPSNQEIFVTI